MQQWLRGYSAALATLAGMVLPLATASLSPGQPTAQPAAGSAEFRLTDALTEPAVFARQWEADFGWEVRPKQTLTCSTFSRQFAIVQASPWGKAVKAEAIITPREALGSDWKMAGVAIHRDAANYWILSLCEAIDSKNRDHFVDFNEARQDVWLAQWEDKLTQMPMAPLPAFRWEYGRQYRLRLEMTPQGIVGSVRELDGTLRWKMGFAFDAGKPAVTDGRPGLVGQSMRSEFRDFTAVVAQQVPAPQVQQVQYPPFTGEGGQGGSRVQGTQTGYFHTQKIGDIWWLIDPAGHGTFYLGTDHVNYNVHWCEALGYAPYHKNVEKKHGGEKAWADSTVKRLLSWGFNGAGANASQSVLHQGLAHTTLINLGAEFCQLGPEYRITFPDNGHAVPCSYFPNVFHPRFAEFCRKRAKRICAPASSDPWLLGYFLDNELAWWGKNWAEPYGLFDECLRKPADHTAKQALIEWLGARYPTAADLAQAWGTNLISYEELSARTELTGTNAARIEQDKRAFVESIADRYFAAATAAVREADPNHMILGCRFAGVNNASYANAWAAAGRYCDVVSTNIYENVDLATGEVYLPVDGQRTPLASYLAKIHAQIGDRPMMVTEWSYVAYDSGLPNTAGAGQRVNTQAQRAFCFEAFQKLLLSRPYMVGSSFFMWADEPAQGIAPWFPEDGNYGLVNVDDQPYELLTSTAQHLHRLAPAVHAGQTMELRVTVIDQAEGQFTIENRGSASGDCVITLRDNGKVSESRAALAPGASQVVRAAMPGGDDNGGAHLLMCEVRPAAVVAEVQSSDNLARQVVVGRAQPFNGLPEGAVRRLPLVVANPTANERPAGPMVWKTKDLSSAASWQAAQGHVAVFDVSSGNAQPVACQLDDLPDGAELAVAVPAVPAYGVRKLIVCTLAQAVPADARAEMRATAVKCQTGPDPNALQITNGRLTLTRNGPGGAIFDRISLDGQELGDLRVMVHQALPANAWPASTAPEKLQVHNGPVRLVLDATMSAQAQASYRAGWRISIYPDVPWFQARALWIGNTADVPWDLVSYFHHIASNLAGKDADDEPKGPVWLDAQAKLAYGIFDPSGSFQGVFWRDKNNGEEHPDFFRPLHVRLSPSQRFADPQPAVYIGGVKGPWPQAWQAWEQQMREGAEVMWRVGAGKLESNK